MMELEYITAEYLEAGGASPPPIIPPPFIPEVSLLYVTPSCAQIMIFSTCKKSFACYNGKLYSEFNS
jgi:hypothetical protein